MFTDFILRNDSLGLWVMDLLAKNIWHSFNTFPKNIWATFYPRRLSIRFGVLRAAWKRKLLTFVLVQSKTY